MSVKTEPRASTHVGRFAPSPTGDLHFGSVVTAVASYISIKQKKGKWILRIDDLDSNRSKKGAADSIKHTLEGLGLFWDGEAVYQTNRVEAYKEAVDKLDTIGKTYNCKCNRKELTPPYLGTCREKKITDAEPHSKRVIVETGMISFTDGTFGNTNKNLKKSIGDFIILRKDQIHAYPLTVTVDDYLDSVTEVVRGCDLLEVTPSQIYLQKLLNFPNISYTHVPVVKNRHGKKLSKQRGASTVTMNRPNKTISNAMKFLGFNVPNGLIDDRPLALLDWATSENREDISASICAKQARKNFLSSS